MFSCFNPPNSWIQKCGSLYDVFEDCTNNVFCPLETCHDTLPNMITCTDFKDANLRYRPRSIVSKPGDLDFMRILLFLSTPTLTLMNPLALPKNDFISRSSQQRSNLDNLNGKHEVGRKLLRSSKLVVYIKTDTISPADFQADQARALAQPTTFSSKLHGKLPHISPVLFTKLGSREPPYRNLQAEVDCNRHQTRVPAPPGGRRNLIRGAVSSFYRLPPLSSKSKYTSSNGRATSGIWNTALTHKFVYKLKSSIRSH